MNNSANPKTIFQFAWDKRASVAYLLGLGISASSLGCLHRPATGLLAFGLGLLGFTMPGRLILVVSTLFTSTAYGLWKMVEFINLNASLDNKKTTVFVVIVIGWCGLVAVALNAFAKAEDTWR